MSDLAVMTEHIRHLDIESIAALTAPELACIMDDLAEQKASLALIEDKLRNALDRKYGDRARQRRAEEGKDTGAVRFEDNGFVVVADLPKRVKWDQEKLQHAVEIIRSGWGDDPADYVKVKLEVSEAAFANWPRPVRELFTPARTVETGRPVYRIETAKVAGTAGRMTAGRMTATAAGRLAPQGRAGNPSAPGQRPAASPATEAEDAVGHR